MPLPEAELASKGDGVGAGCVEELGGREGHLRGVEDAAAEPEEGNDQDELQRVDDVVADLRGGYVEAEDGGDGQAKQRGGSECGVDADEKADGDAPGQATRVGSHAE